VLLSGRGEAGALLGEEAVRESGAEWTVVRSSFMNQNFDEGAWVDSLRSGELAAPAGEVAEPFIDADDIADVAVAALTGESPSRQVYEVSGPRLLTFADAVAEIAKAAGRQIYSNEPWHYELRPEAIDGRCPPTYADPTHDPRMQQ
jgi:uncharacterized protein YbjT (DUF2867 family)